MKHAQGWLILLAVAVCLEAFPVLAQQVHVSTPLIGVNDSFYEHINIGWGFRHNGPRGSWFMNFGGPNSVIPAFGGYDPNADLRFGFGNRNFQFNLAASQGSNRSLTMSAPSVTMMNGAQGQFFSGSVRPFVTGLIPVVGDYPAVPYVVYPYAPASPPVFTSPLAERLERLRHETPVTPATAATATPEDDLILGADAEAPAAIGTGSAPSSATRGDISVAEIRRQQALDDEAKRVELERWIEEARVAERNGQLGVARVRYQQAASRATGDQRRQLLESLARLKPQR